CFAELLREGASEIVANTSRIQAIAETAVIAAKVNTGMRSKPAEMYAGSRVPGKNRLNARLNWPSFLRGLLVRVFPFSIHPANHRCCVIRGPMLRVSA